MITLRFTEEDLEKALLIINQQFSGFVDKSNLGIFAEKLSVAGIKENGEDIYPSRNTAKRILNELGYKRVI